MKNRPELVCLEKASEGLKMRRTVSVLVLLFLTGLALCPQSANEDLVGKAVKAIRDNDLPTLQDLIRNPDVLKGIDRSFGFSLLHWAVELRREDMVRILLDAGIDFEKKTTYQKASPLVLACYTGNLAIFRMLINKGAALDSPERLVLAAASGGSVEMIAYLVGKGLSLDVRDGGDSPLDLALQHGHREMADFLLKSDKRLGNGPFLIHSAAYGGKIDLVETCLKLGQSIDSQNDKGWTPLHIAVLEKNLPLARFLAEKGASLSIRSRESWERHEDHIVFPDRSTPLSFAVLNNDRPMLDLIMGRTSRRDFDREAVPLFYYTRVYGYQDMCEYLIARCSDVNSRDENGWTLLHQAAFWDADEKTIGMILDRGANLEAKTSAPYEDWRKWEFPAGSTVGDVSRIVGGMNFPRALTRRGIPSEETNAYRWGPTRKGDRIDVCRDGSIWLVAPMGTVFYTEGVERTWRSFPLEKAGSPCPNSEYSGIHWLNGQKGMGWGMIRDNQKFVVKITDDRGKTWSSIPLESAIQIYDVFSDERGEAWMGGSSGEIFYSSDAGQHWVKRNSLFDPQTRTSSIFMTDSRSGMAGSLLGDALYITRDNWQTSESIPTPFGQRGSDFPKMDYADHRFLRVAQWGKFYLVNQGGRVYYSLRDRIEWKPFSENLWSFSIDPISSRCLAVTSGHRAVELVVQGDEVGIRDWGSSSLPALPVDIRAMGSSLYVLDEESCISKISEKEFIRRPIMVESQDRGKAAPAVAVRPGRWALDPLARRRPEA